MADVTHIARPNLPWRDENRTECGLDSTRHATWSREEAQAKAKEMGRQRFSLFACMTCTSTFGRHSTWEQDPASCLNRYTERYGMRYRIDDTGERRQFADELRAIALLIEAHRDEFDALITGLADTTTLDAARARRRYS